jgi:hypothetical protein
MKAVRKNNRRLNGFVVVQNDTKTNTPKFDVLSSQAAFFPLDMCSTPTENKEFCTVETPVE